MSSTRHSDSPPKTPAQSGSYPGSCVRSCAIMRLNKMDDIYKDWSDAPAGREIDQAIDKEWFTGGLRQHAGKRWSTVERHALWLLRHITIMTGCSAFFVWDLETRVYRVELEYDPPTNLARFWRENPAGWSCSGKADELSLAICRAALHKVDPNSEEGENAALQAFVRSATNPLAPD